MQLLRTSCSNQRHGEGEGFTQTMPVDFKELIDKDCQRLLGRCQLVFDVMDFLFTVHLSYIPYPKKNMTHFYFFCETGVQRSYSLTKDMSRECKRRHCIRMAPTRASRWHSGSGREGQPWALGCAWQASHGWLSSYWPRRLAATTRRDAMALCGTKARAAKGR